MVENKTLIKENYSEKICEICGVIPKYIVNYNYFGLQENEYKNIEEAEKEAKMLNGVIWKFYVDFENENFAQLFNLKYDEYKDSTIANYIYDRYKHIVNTRSFLGYLLFELEHNNNEDIKKIKESIRQEKWSI